MYVNESKHQRALKKLKDDARAKGADMAAWQPREEDVKAEYLKMGGLWVPENEIHTEENHEASTAVRRGRGRPASSDTE